MLGAPSPPSFSPGASIASQRSSLTQFRSLSIWPVARPILAHAHFFQSLADFDLFFNAAKVFPALRHFVEDPEFNPTFVGKTSQGAARLCAWVHAVAGCIPPGDKWAVTRQALEKDLASKVDACAQLQRRVEALEAAVQG